jgi:hypothetical protein
LYFANSSALGDSETVTGTGTDINSDVGATCENSDEGSGASAGSTGGGDELRGCCVVETGGISSMSSS